MKGSIYLEKDFYQTQIQNFPIRQCLICKKRTFKFNLLRLAYSPERRIEVDISKKKKGRGLYCCLQENCLVRLNKKGILKGFRLPPGPLNSGEKEFTNAYDKMLFTLLHLEKGVNILNKFFLSGQLIEALEKKLADTVQLFFQKNITREFIRPLCLKEFFLNRADSGSPRGDSAENPPPLWIFKDAKLILTTLDDTGTLEGFIRQPFRTTLAHFAFSSDPAHDTLVFLKPKIGRPFLSLFGCWVTETN